MSAIIAEIFFILVLVVANGVFSGSEISVVSSRRVRLEQIAKQGNRSANAAISLINSPNDFLSAVQIGITLIGILSGAVGGATIAQRIKPIFESIPSLKSYSEGLSVVVVVTVITYLSLVVGELAPKRIALGNPEKFACAIARPMKLLARITAPIVHILGTSTDALLKVMGVQASDEPEMTEEEIKVLIRQGAQSGLFEETEHKMLERVFQLGDRPIRAMMTPRTEIDWLDMESSLEENIELIMSSSHSRFPVGHGSLDDCVGIIRGKNLLAAKLADQSVNIETIVQPPLYVAENTRVLNVISQFKNTGVHIALVTDEYGGVEGLVTLSDLMEAIVGSLPSAEHHEEPLVVQREDGSWLLDGFLDIHDFKNLVNREQLPEEETSKFHTLGGFVLNYLGRVPDTGETFNWENLRFEVVDMDGVRIDKILMMIVDKSDQ
ncbi:hemolysin family protein [Synechococcus elongatus]|uniref:hemolysin family protein n=1 Tax=Synechococcus elongatus TaxID=32046 RepID=UPI0030CE2E16